MEIKASETIISDMFKGFEYFEKYAKNLVKSKTLVHTGLQNQSRTNAEVRSWIDIAKEFQAS